jgi:hypothetical protein
MTPRILAFFVGCGSAVACSSGAASSPNPDDAGVSGAFDASPDAPAPACERGVMPADTECTTVVPIAATSFKAPANDNQWVVSWTLQGMASHLQLWVGADFAPHAGACKPYTSLPTLEMQCDNGTGGTGALATIGVYALTSEPPRWPSPLYLAASGSLELTAVDPGVVKWAGKMARMKIVEACGIPNIETTEIVPRKNGRCYFVGDARWDTRALP